MTHQVKRCCDESKWLWDAYKVYPNGWISIELDDYSDYDNVKFCAYCGKALELERTPDTPKPQPYKPDLSAMSPKDRALEELKEMTITIQPGDSVSVTMKDGTHHTIKAINKT
jgi:hypothetical protein